MQRGFRDALASIVPVWLSNRPNLNNGFSFLFVQMLVLDVLTQAQSEGLQAAWPGVGTNTADALIGQTRQIIRGESESDASYETRLRFWLDTWILAGSPWGLLINILAFLNDPTFAAQTVDDSGNYDRYEAGATADPFNPPTHTQPSASLGWNWDGAAPPFFHEVPFWWRLWLVLYTTGPWSSRPHWGDGGRWGDVTRRWGIGTTFTQEIQDDLLALCRAWKAADTWIPFIIISFDTTALLPISGNHPNGTWGRWGVVGLTLTTNQRVYIPSRPNTAAYIDGVT